jgi:membrane protein
VTSAGVKRALARATHNALEDRTLREAAALSYYSILCIFPALILLSAIMAYIPLPHLFADLLTGLDRVFPAGAIMPTVYSVLIGVLGSNLRAWLSLGTLGTLWLVSSAFDEMIEAMNMAYGASDNRPFWKTRVLALFMAAVTGALLICTIGVMVLGPAVGTWLTRKIALSGTFLYLWPFVHRIIAIAFAIFAIQCVYYLAPNLKQRFLATLPGAVLAVACLLGLSFLLGIYFRHFANYNRLYGTLGGLMALMTWLYWAYFIVLVGAELNAELAKENRLLAMSDPHPSNSKHAA